MNTQSIDEAALVMLIDGKNSSNIQAVESRRK